MATSSPPLNYISEYGAVILLEPLTTLDRRINPLVPFPGNFINADSEGVSNYALTAAAVFVTWLCRWRSQSTELAGLLRRGCRW